jgi:hypothetical protein
MASSGKVKGIARFRQFGYNPDIDTTTTPEDVVYWGGSNTIPSTAYTVNIVSDSAEDGAGTETGTNVIRIIGVDTNFDILQEDISLNGTGTVTTTGEFLFINTTFGISSGSVASNAGTITFTHSTGGQTLATIPAEQGQSQQCWGVVPNEYAFYIDTISGSVSNKGASASAVIHYEIMVHGTNTWRNLFTMELHNQSGVASNKTGHLDYVVLPSKTYFRAHIETVTSNNTEVASNIGGYMIDLTEFSF